MATRGNYRKGAERRAEILAKAVELTEREGFSATTIRRLADEVGVTPGALLHHFGSKDALMTEVLRHRDEAAAAAAVSPEGTPRPLPVQTFVDAILSGIAVPGHAHFMTHILVDSTDPEHPGHEYTRQRYEQTRQGFAQFLQSQAADGRLRDGIDPAVAASMLIALSDGLQIQWLHDPELDLREILEAFFGLILSEEE